MNPATEPSNSQLRKAIYSLALPIVWSNLLQRGVGIIDAMMVGHLGAEELAAVGMSQLVVFLTSAMIMGIGIGSMVLVAHATGAKEHDKVTRIVGTGLMLGIIASIFLTIAGYYLSYPAAIFIGASPEVAVLSEDYLQIIYYFFFARALIFILSSAFQGSGDSKTPLYVILLVNIVHVAIALPFIYGIWDDSLGIYIAPMGVEGAAWATGLSELGGIVLLFYLAIKKNLLKLSELRLDGFLLKRIVKLGTPVFFERLLITSSQMVYAKIVVVFSVAAYAAHQIGFNIEALAFLPGLGFAQAATAMVGQNLGAKHPKRAKRVGYQSNLIALAVMILFGISYLIIPRFWVGLFSNDAQVVAFGITFCYIAAFIQAPLASSMVFAGALRGAGQTRFVMFTTIIGAWGVRVPFAYLVGIVLGGGIFWVWMAMLIDWICRSLLLFSRFRWGKQFSGNTSLID